VKLGLYSTIVKSKHDKIYKRSIDIHIYPTFILYHAYVNNKVAYKIWVDRKPLGGSIKNVLPKKKKEKISFDNRKNKIPIYWWINLWLGRV
jgi:hypothetical protein